MSAEEEFARWLRRPEKSIHENFQFALKAWRSADFTLSNKYEAVLRWLAEESRKFVTNGQNNFPIAEFKELLQLRAQPGLIDQQVKSDFVEMLLNLGNAWQHQKGEITTTRQIAELLHSLTEFNPLQDLFRFDYELHARIYATLLQHYEIYLEHVDAGLGNTFQLEHETVFFASILKSLLDNAKNAGDIAKFEEFYTNLVLQPLVQVLLLLRKHELCFNEELLCLESLLTENATPKELLQRALTPPLHIRLLTIECAIVNRRSDEKFLKRLLNQVFVEQRNADGAEDQALTLTVVAYTLEMLRKHEINLNFEMKEQESCLAFVGAKLLPYVQKCKESHLHEVLMLLCAALRLNPLILEQQVFQITTWMIVATKVDRAEQKLFEEYLVLLIDMFRRLSRSEKFVANLLRALKEYLSKFTLPSTPAQQGKRKSKENSTPSNPAKMQKTEESIQRTNNSFNSYLEILFKDFCKLPSSQEVSTSASQIVARNFPQLHAHWPSSTVGMAFSKLITGLVTKPSLVIWKSLVYTLKELLESLAKTPQLDENFLLLLDLNAALLCQYFGGSRLLEQFEKFTNQIDELRQVTSDVLALFGRSLLAREHNQRTMSAFLECSFYAANFEMLLAFYRPDGSEWHGTLKASEGTDQLHAFLAAQEWTLIQQRVLNFGKSNCKFLLNRLLLQRSQARLLVQTNTGLQGSTTAALGLSKQLLSPVSTDPDQLVMLLSEPQTKWILTKLNRGEKVEISKLIWNRTELCAVFENDLELLELISIALFENLCIAFSSGSKGSLLSTLRCDFDAIRKGLDTCTAEKHTQELIEQINSRLEEYKLKKYPQEQAETALLTLHQFPISHLRRQAKCFIFAFVLAFYRDLKAAQANDSAAIAFELLTDLLHFGQQVPIFKYFPAAAVLDLFPIEKCWEFYELLFANIKSDVKGTDRFLVTLAEILKTNANCNKGKLNDDQRRLLLSAIDSLSSIVGPRAKHMRKILDAFLETFAVLVNAHFNDTHIDCSKKDKKFVSATLAGFAPYANAILSKAAAGTKDANGELEKEKQPVDERFRRIAKIYIGHSMDYRNPHGVSLMQVALHHRQQLHLDQVEVEFMLSEYWRHLNEDLKTTHDSQQQLQLNSPTTERVVKMIIGHKTNEDLLLTLKDIGAHIDKDCMNVTRLLALIAKCPLSTIKGAIFNDQFKQIISNLTLRLVKDEHQQCVNVPQAISLLACHQAIVENKMVTISIDTLDSILAFLIDLNIKKFTITNTNVNSFHSLHLAMSDVCAALLKQRHALLSDRVPQFMHIFKDLLQSIVWYRSDRTKDTALSATELDDLAELALKMEALMHIIAMHSVAVKRVAPFVLTFVIDLMVTSKRPTTLYPKIKTHIESICYDLIGICDHRVGRFILRCSNEASRQSYELLVKEYKKYHKFKGKV